MKTSEWTSWCTNWASHNTVIARTVFCPSFLLLQPSWTLLILWHLISSATRTPLLVLASLFVHLCHCALLRTWVKDSVATMYSPTQPHIHLNNVVVEAHCYGLQCRQIDTLLAHYTYITRSLRCTHHKHTHTCTQTQTPVRGVSPCVTVLPTLTDHSWRTSSSKFATSSLCVSTQSRMC